MNYGTAALYAAYALAHGWDDAAVPSDDDDTTAALLVASEYIDSRYRAAFPGERTGGRAQEREWPRQGAYETASNNSDVPGYRTGNAIYYPIGANEIPREILQATYEVAKRQVINPGSLRTDFTLAKSYKQVSVDGAISVTFAGANSADDAQLTIAGLDAILAPILSSAGTSSSLNGKLTRV